MATATPENPYADETIEDVDALIDRCRAGAEGTKNLGIYRFIKTEDAEKADA